MADNRGLYRKFQIQRTDGSSGIGGKHEHCCYFVLDLDHDPHAGPALLAYADSCEADRPVLAEDLRALVEADRDSAARPKRHSDDPDGAGMVAGLLRLRIKGLK